MIRRLLASSLLLAAAAPCRGQLALAADGYVSPGLADALPSSVDALPRNYFGSYLVARDSTVRRWADRRADPIRVWVQQPRRLRGWHDAFPAMVADAFAEWESVGIPVRFRLVADSASAEVRVLWTERLSQGESGRTVWWSTAEGWIRRAHVTLAMHASDGVVQQPRALRAVALHEIGHVLGLSHTPDARDIMAPWVEVAELSAADRATARILYRLPSGRVAAGDARVAEAAAGVALADAAAPATIETTVTADDLPVPLAPLSARPPVVGTVAGASLALAPMRPAPLLLALVGPQD